jgi:hypothetical protein
MFDRLAWRRECYERYLLGLDGDEEPGDEEPGDEEFWADPEEQADIDDYETPMGELARMADDVEAGRTELPPRWKLDRPSPGVQIWTTPSGRRCACGPTGELLPLPDGEAPFHSWTA